VALCQAFHIFYRKNSSFKKRFFIIPINEVNFISWLGGDACGTAPYCKGYGWQVKYKLMDAYIQAVAAMKNDDDNICIISSEPLVNMVPPEDASQNQTIYAALRHTEQFQATDMLCGKICPELNGNPAYLDIIGLNYYYNNQWICGTETFLPWGDEPKDIRWRTPASLLCEVHQHYNKPMLITETSHPREHRPNWIKDFTLQVIKALQSHLPVWGVCLYPIIDRPDWNDLSNWHHSGLWDIDSYTASCERILCMPYAQALLYAQQQISEYLSVNKTRKTYEAL